MGTSQHRPSRDKTTFEAPAQDAAAPSPGPGVRPGTRSRIQEARERAARRP